MNNEEHLAEVQATEAALPNEPRRETIEKAEEIMKSAEALVYRVDSVFVPLENRRRRMIRATCTACGEDTIYEQAEVTEGCHTGGYGTGIGFIGSDGRYVRSGERYECEWCGTGVETIHVSKFKKECRIESCWVGEIHNVRGHLAVLAWFFEKVTDKMGHTTLKWHHNEGIFIVDRTPYRVCGWSRYMYNLCNHDKWTRYGKYTDSFGVWSKAEFVYDPSVIDETDSANCALDKLLTDLGKNVRPGAYLWMWCKCPAVENLVTSGQTDYVAAIIKRMTYTTGYYGQSESFKVGGLNRYIDIKKVKPHDMMRCDKSERDLWRTLGIEKFAFRGYVYKSCGIKLTNERIEQCTNEGLDNWRALLKKRGRFTPGAERTFNYLDREKLKYLRERYKKSKKPKSVAKQLQEDLDLLNKYGSTTLVSPAYLGDYWNMLSKVYDGRMPEELIYPRDLIKAHDDVLKLVKEKASAALRDRFLKRYNELSLLSYSDEETGLMIRPCATQNEMITEGEQLHHCVGGYANQHAQGTTAIFFIRRIDAPEVPYYTLEYRGGRVAQNRGNKNCARTPEVEAFEEKWLRHIKQMTMEVKKNERDHRSKDVRAGA